LLEKISVSKNTIILFVFMRLCQWGFSNEPQN
jgi:hypothetical protein